MDGTAIYQGVCAIFIVLSVTGSSLHSDRCAWWFSVQHWLPSEQQMYQSWSNHACQVMSLSDSRLLKRLQSPVCNDLESMPSSNGKNSSTSQETSLLTCVAKQMGFVNKECGNNYDSLLNTCLADGFHRRHFQYGGKMVSSSIIKGFRNFICISLWIQLGTRRWP